MTMTRPSEPAGDVDLARAAKLFADRTRARILRALLDGRALPASVLASEAGVTPQAVSSQLSRLRDAGLVAVEPSGRHRYYRLASDHVATIMEALAVIAPAEPIRSLREGTRAAALRRSRTCYDHLAGQLGCAITQSLVEHGALTPIDGDGSTRRRPGQRLSSPVPEAPFRLGPRAAEVFGRLGVAGRHLDGAPRGRRPLLRFCLDWTEQRHHLAGQLGADVLTAMIDGGWITRRPRHRAVDLTDVGATELRRCLALDV